MRVGTPFATHIVSTPNGVRSSEGHDKGVVYSRIKAYWHSVSPLVFFRQIQGNDQSNKDDRINRKHTAAVRQVCLT